MVRARLFFQLNLDCSPMNIIHKLSILLLSLYVPVSAKPQKKITFLVAEREYKTIETLPRFAKEHLAKKFSVQFCKAPDEGEKRNILSLPSEIRKADLLFVSVRRRSFREQTMKLIHSHFTRGKPIIGIRTSSHAFQLRKEKLLDGHQEWPEWDREVIGGRGEGKPSPNGLYVSLPVWACARCVSPRGGGVQDFSILPPVSSCPRALVRDRVTGAGRWR